MHGLDPPLENPEFRFLRDDPIQFRRLEFRRLAQYPRYDASLEFGIDPRLQFRVFRFVAHTRLLTRGSLLCPRGAAYPPAL